MRTRRTASSKRRRVVSMQRRILGMASLLLILSLGSAASIFTLAADRPVSFISSYQEPEYKKVFINSGDSLWSIAEKYNTDEYRTTSEYVQEIMEINNLTSHEVYSGHYLIIEL